MNSQDRRTVALAIVGFVGGLTGGYILAQAVLTLIALLCGCIGAVGQ